MNIITDNKERNTLNSQKERQDDEYFTRLCDIEKELTKYRKQFKGKRVYLNCDNANISKFWWYLYVNADMFGIKYLEATCYHDEDKDGSKLEHGEYWAYDPINKHYNDDVICNACNNNEVVFDNVEHKILEGNGSFDSEECKNILSNTDVVITNPPFSLFREFIKFLVNSNKKFLVIGPMNGAITNNVFNYIKNGTFWTGYNAPSIFARADGTTKNVACWWYTNLVVNKYEEIRDYYNRYNEDMYPKYENYDAIDCKHGEDIPCDYTGIIGVPSTYLRFINTKQFEILEHHEPYIELKTYVKRGYKASESRQGKVKGILCNKTFHRVFIKWKPEAMPEIDEDDNISYYKVHELLDD